ncbi:hypothetical protein NKI38_29005 [Mesorhizobium sp. M0621]|uniref:hypothetical protein n=1 Tax=Mesorhizobium sp. M0621 TaxID=2956974 RepID=UPI0033388168
MRQAASSNGNPEKAWLEPLLVAACCREEGLAASHPANLHLGAILGVCKSWTTPALAIR